MGAESGDWSEDADWTDRLSYRAAIVGMEVVAADPAVVAFRKRWLPDGLVSEDTADIEQTLDRWVHAAATHRVGSDDHRHWTPGDPDHVYRYLSWHDSQREDQAHFDEDQAMPALRLEVAVGDGVRLLRAPPYLAIGELMWLGHDLYERFGWTEPSARTWVLTGTTIPAVPAIRYKLDNLFFNSVRGDASEEWHRTVTFEVALDVPPSRLADVMREIQEEEANNYHWPLPPRGKPIAMWNLRATLFALQRNDGRGWATVRDEWNAQTEHSEWRFAEDVDGERLFARTVRRTYAALMGSDRRLDWKRKARGEGRSQSS